MIRVGGETVGGDFLSEISRASGVEIQECYQCGKCSAGCPMADEMDILPNQVHRFIQLNLRETLFRAKAFWLCVSCQTCTSRCPKGIDTARVMDTLKIMALAGGARPSDRFVSQFQRLFVNNIRRHGRLNEIELVALFNLRTFQPFKDILLAPKLHQRGKLSLEKHDIRDIHSVERIFQLAKPFAEHASAPGGHGA